MIDFNEKNCLNVQYELLKDFYFDDKEETEDYIFCSSKRLDDSYWNIAYIKGKLDAKVLKELESKFSSMDRKPAIYLGRNINYEHNRAFLIDNGYKLNISDNFMKLEKNNGVEIKIRIKPVETEKEYNDFMKVILSAFNDSTETSSENIYAGAVTEHCYKVFKDIIGSKEHIQIIAYDDNNVPVSAANFNYKNGISEFDYAGTAQGHWNKGYGKQLVSYIMNKFEELGGGLLFICAEYHTKNQEFYEKLGFKELYVMEQYTK